jgi:RimJ/RimL family protein N-acetyltransferase
MDAIRAHTTRPVPPLRHRIDGNRWVSIRPIERADVAGLSDFYARLSPESRRRRFLSCGTRLDRELAATFTQGEGSGFVGILDEPGPNDGSVGAHASVQPDDNDAAEIAFAVADEFQGHGIGTALMKAVVQHAGRVGLLRLNAMLFAENVPMRRLLRNAGCALRSDSVDFGVEEIALDVAR